MDSAFKTAAYPAYTTAYLEQRLAEAKADGVYETDASYATMEAEIARRKAVKAGDRSQMTPGERLRSLR